MHPELAKNVTEERGTRGAPNEVALCTEPELVGAFRAFLQEAAPQLGLVTDLDQPNAYLVEWRDDKIGISCFRIGDDPERCSEECSLASGHHGDHA